MIDPAWLLWLTLVCTVILAGFQSGEWQAIGRNLRRWRARRSADVTPPRAA
jgi:hypothetical protein